MAVRKQLLLRAARTVARELRKDGGPTPADRGRPARARPGKGRAGGARIGRIVGFVVHYGLFLAIAASAVAFFMPALGGLGGAKAILELVVGVVHGRRGPAARHELARRALAVRPAPRRAVGGARRAPGEASFEALRWRLLGYAFFGVGLAWIALGVSMLGQGASDLF